MRNFAARELGVDPLDLRRAGTFIAKARDPVSLCHRVYDRGRFFTTCFSPPPRTRPTSRGSPPAATPPPRRAGCGGPSACATTSKSILGDPDETATIEITEPGARVYVGTQSNGQGHETVYAQLLHDQTGLPLDSIEIVQGDSDLIAKGGAPAAPARSRCRALAIARHGRHADHAAFCRFLDAEMDQRDTSFDPGEERVPRPWLQHGHSRCWRAPPGAPAPGRQGGAGAGHADHHPARPLLPQRLATSREIEIDRDTGATRVDRYTVVDDFGNLMNPRLAEGQVHGGIAQGIGQALTEHVV